MEFPVSRKQLISMAGDEAAVPRDFVRGVVLHRIIGEVFKLAAEGRHRYSCDILDKDVIPFITRLVTLFPDCTIAVKGQVMPGWSDLTIEWL